MQEIIDKLSTYTGWYDTDENWKISFLERSYTKAQEKEFLEWLFDRCYNDEDFRKDFMVYPRKNKNLVSKVVDQFNLNYSPRTI